MYHEQADDGEDQRQHRERGELGEGLEDQVGGQGIPPARLCVLPLTVYGFLFPRALLTTHVTGGGFEVRTRCGLEEPAITGLPACLVGAV